jgi:hypothetical protein
MRKLKTLWRSALSPRVCEELETWIGVLLALAAAVLLFATLKAQGARAAELAGYVAAPARSLRAAALESTMAAGARGTPWCEAYVHAVLAPGMPPNRIKLPPASRARVQGSAS